MREWKQMYKEAKKKLNSKELSPFVSIASTSCVIKTNNSIYVGININEHSAEESAITLMVNNGESVVLKMIVISELEEIIKPKLIDLEYLLSVNMINMNTEVMIGENEIVTLKELLPDWWGTYRPDYLI